MGIIFRPQIVSKAAQNYSKNELVRLIAKTYTEIMKQGKKTVVAVPEQSRRRPEAKLPTLTRIKPDVPLRSQQEREKLPIKKPHPNFSADIKDHLEVQLLIRGYQTRGHLIADLDPLGIWREKDPNPSEPHKYVKRQHHVPQDRDSVFQLPQFTAIGKGSDGYLPLKEIIERLHKTYCRSIGIEYTYITSDEKCQWIRDKFESPLNFMKVPESHRKKGMDWLLKAHYFESFIAENLPAHKTLGIEGCEVLIPAINMLIEQALREGAQHFNLGMSLRGRLSVLTNVLKMDVSEVLHQYHGFNVGDIKYHLGGHNDIIHKKNKYRISISASPSHLETVNPYVIGKTKAEQVYYGDETGTKIWPIMIHGDAGMCGQGVVYETFHLAQLPSFTTYGTIHFVIDNQVGFTTDPIKSRASEYCTDAAKVVSAPVFHVNADDVDAVLFVSTVAAQYRAKFKEDVVVDLVCYRRHGLADGDEPSFTQPRMYARISEIQPVFYKYSDKLLKEGVLDKDEINKTRDTYVAALVEGLKKARNSTTALDVKRWVDSPWEGRYQIKEHPSGVYTGVDKPTLMKIGKAFASVPKDLDIHRGLQRVLKLRNDMLLKDSLDWATCEAFAIGSLLLEGVHVRLSGEDVERGTFSHRHHVVHHQTKDKEFFNPFTSLAPNQGLYTICNSSLSELAVTGFELGYAQVDPNSLVLWEAQFGDFVNMAQCTIDQYISSGEYKWFRQNGIVFTLPHGMEGQGPEHSSGRPERMLQLCSDDETLFEPDMMNQLQGINIIVANPTTPANYFHIIRRQLRFPFRKPLVIFSPKSLLRHPDARSKFADMAPNTEFLPFIKDTEVKSGPQIKNLLLCTGKVYYDLADERSKRNLLESIAISRVEQVAPFPYKMLKEDMERFPKAKICWVQEEHKNQGWWNYVHHRILTTLGENRKRGVKYIGRQASPSPATGAKLTHIKEKDRFINEAMTV